MEYLKRNWETLLFFALIVLSVVNVEYGGKVGLAICGLLPMGWLGERMSRSARGVG